MLNPLQGAQCLLTSFRDRDEFQNRDSDAIQQQRNDATVYAYCSSLQGFPFERWRFLCDGSGPQPMLVAVATYCQNFSWEPVGNWITENSWKLQPMEQTTIAASFCKKVGLPENAKELPLSKVMNAQYQPDMTAFLLFALDGAPAFDVAKDSAEGVNPQIAQALAWFWARDGYGKVEYEILRTWANGNQYDTGLRFWALFALVLRHAALHDLLPELQKLTDSDITREKISAAMQQALSEEPFTSATAKIAFDNLSDGTRLQRLTRALRFAAFLPGIAPFVDPTAPWHKQEQLTARLKAALEQAIVSGASFTPAAYVEKARRAHALKTEADKREKKLKECMEPRGWNDDMVVEALANGPGIPVLGYPYGPTLLRFHPETLLPIVSCAVSGEVIHIGRNHYVYNIDWDAYSAIPEETRPPLPIWYDVRSTNPESVTVYIPLKEEWIDVWRPTPALFLPEDGPDFYVLRAREIPQDEAQEFWIGVCVRCSLRRFGKGTALAAVKRAERRW